MPPAKRCDVCIVGSGPAGLATLSALRESYTLDSLNDRQINEAMRHVSKVPQRSICVVDPSPTWMNQWHTNFETLGIEYLRSPAMAHPDYFDQNALLAFATTLGREKELIESGCFDISSLLPLGQSQIGLWKLPSTKLFRDFCAHLTKRSKHDYVSGKVVALDREGPGVPFTVTLEDGRYICADSVVLAMGMIGKPIIPKSLERLIPSSRMIQWSNMSHDFFDGLRRVLVIGGGLTAIQVAQYALRKGKEVVLCTRRPLVERHFDIDVEWFDRRVSNKCMADFYHEPIDKRLTLIKETRGGGSVPPIYLKDLRSWEESGRLRIEVGDPVVTSNDEHDRSTTISINDQCYHFDGIILACGVKPDCTANPLISRILEKWPTKIAGGFPSISEDLEWTDNLFVVGGLGSLNIGPDAGNVMGMKRAASIVANQLGCRCWLRETKVLGSRFHVFIEDTESEDELA